MQSPEEGGVWKERELRDESRDVDRPLERESLVSTVRNSITSRRHTHEALYCLMNGAPPAARAMNQSEGINTRPGPFPFCHPGVSGRQAVNQEFLLPLLCFALLCFA